MSLFPAYDDGKNKKPSNSNAENLEKSADANVKWQHNQSFEVPAQPVINCLTEIRPSDSGPRSGAGLAARPGAGSESSQDSDTDLSDSDSDSTSDSDSSRRALKKNAQPPSLEFDGDVQYYVDKFANKQYLQWTTLPRLTRPKYSINLRSLIDRTQPQSRRTQKSKRPRLSKLLKERKPSSKEIEKKTKRIQELQNLLANEPQQLDKWIELHTLLESTATKTNRQAVVEQQVHKLETALAHHPGNEKLMKLYAVTANASYPESQVANKIEEVLQLMPYEYTLWSALIMTTQGSMARSNVPDVLVLFQQCMTRMQRKHMYKRPQPPPRQADELILKLFNNCLMYMRQSGHSAQMFAMLKLEVGINLRNVDLKCLDACTANEAPLVEYEELVLRSGMPMHEIWTRVERLRMSFFFLPYSQMTTNISKAFDWQRFVYSSDVSAYVFPLQCRESRMQLLLLAMQLTKLPFVRTDCLADRLYAPINSIGDSEAIEILLVEMGDRFTYSLPKHSSGLDYNKAVIQMAKELATNPTFLSHAIGHEIYVDCINEMLLKFSDTLQDSSQRLVFLLLWFRFERLRLTMLKIGGQVTAEHYVKARQRMRDLLKQPANKDSICLYTEAAITEYETAPNNENVERSTKILNTVLSLPSDYQNPQMLQALVVRVELLLAQEKKAEALHVLKCLALGKSPSSGPDEITATPDELIQCSSVMLDAALAAMREETKGAVDTMPLEQYFIPNRLVLLLRTHCLMLCLLNEVDKASKLLDQLLGEPLFALEPDELEPNELESDELEPDELESDELEPNKLERTRCRFLREQVRELQLMLVYHTPSQNKTLGYRLRTMLEPALMEFPRNMAFLHHWSTLWTLPWYKLSSRLIHCKAGILSVLHLIIGAHMRFKQYYSNGGEGEADVQNEQQHQRQLQHNRLINMFETFLPTNPHRSEEAADQYALLRRNSLYWRLYLRSLSTEHTSFERSNRCLLMALDECPWDKSLYMEGITYVPQKTSNLQDVMVEKQLRMYALPDELNVLRNGNQNSN
ncbi:PREDICTED: uncharacterized protein LOC108619220 [Drosophila arizonae]|uniref:Uncharacterized protein LOC108619220 n=1 Tax=Drosophila arizonae TaxID=7263 RepID=A0ABM1PVF1_DROAR|nr:PREDICTED: uncharacterized protein LOC108619220 [Drosophila arizonae]